MRPLLTSLILLSAPLAADEFFTLKGHGGPIMGIAVAPGGQIATASFDNSVGLWSDATPAWLENHRAAVNAVVFASDDLMFSAGDDFAVVRWNLAADTATRLEGHKGKVVALRRLARSHHGCLGKLGWQHWPLAYCGRPAAFSDRPPRRDQRSGVQFRWALGCIRLRSMARSGFGMRKAAPSAE